MVDMNIEKLTAIVADFLKQGNTIIEYNKWLVPYQNALQSCINLQDTVEDWRLILNAQTLMYDHMMRELNKF